jgi:hypothetical protein
MRTCRRPFDRFEDYATNAKLDVSAKTGRERCSMPTYHDLDGFDMVYALTDQTINSQFKLLWALGVLPSSWNASIKNGLYSIDAQLGTPSFSLDTKDKSASNVNLVLPLSTGTFNYASVEFDDDGNPVVKRQKSDISGSTLQLTSSLRLADIAASYSDASHIPAEVKAQLDAFDDSMFDIQHLFMDLEDANLLNTFQFNTNGRIDMTQPELVGRVRDLIQAYVNGIKNSGNPYILGYSVTNSQSEGSDATWKPTGATFSTYPDGAYPLRSSLNYLLETNNKPVPVGNVGIFTSNWVTQDNVQGTFVFSQALVLDLVLGALAKALNISTDSFSAGANGDFTATIANDIQGNTTVTVSPVAGTNTIDVAFHATFRKEMYDKAGSDIGYVDGWINWVSTMTFTVDSKTHDVNVDVTNSQPQTQKNDHPNSLGQFEDFLAIFADFIISVFTFGQVQNLFEDMIKEDWTTNLSTNLGVAFQGVRTRIVLPAGSELIYKDVRFLSDGTMLLTTTIQD